MHPLANITAVGIATIVAAVLTIVLIWGIVTMATDDNESAAKTIDPFAEPSFICQEAVRGFFSELNENIRLSLTGGGIHEEDFRNFFEAYTEPFCGVLDDVSLPES